MNGFPTWVKVVAQVGFPIALAIWLVTYASPKIAATEQQVAQHRAETEQQTILLRAICRNTAKTELQASFCDFGRATP
jgi:hypothetical protein